MNYWVGVVSKEHVLKGIKGGFAQVCHGKKFPLQKMAKGDWLIYYSPKTSFSKKEVCQEFTAIGQVKSTKVYQVSMNNEFHPFRIDIVYYPSIALSYHKIKAELQFTKTPLLFRRGFFSIIEKDFQLLAKAMGVQA